MKIDWQTLQDLGILHPRGSQLSVFDWVNRTRTVGGGQRLKERFRAPLSDPAELRRTQEAVRFLASHPGLADPVLGGSAWTAAEHYGRTSFTPIDHPNALFLWLDSWWIRRLRADVFASIRASLALTQTLVRGAAHVAGEIRAADPPPLLAEWTAELEACLATPALAALARGPDVDRRSPPRVLRLDRALRDEDFRPLADLASLAYEIDALAAMALTTREGGLVFPEIVEGERPFVEGEAVYHPLLERPVANPLRVSPEARLSFLTGPNIAGKSTFLRASGVAVFLAHLGMGVPARSFRLVPFDCLFSGIDTEDNLRLGQSYFFREVRRVREAAEILSRGASAFMIFDELFRGTNLKDASDACLALLSGFAASRGSAFLVASHLAELAEPLQRLSGARFLQVGAELRDGVPAFDYRVSPGVSEQRLGMLILERERVLALLDGLQSASEPR